MKPLLICTALLVAGCQILTMTIAPQPQQSLTLPARTPVVCQPGFTLCSYPNVLAGATGVVVARNAPSGITDSLGNQWAKDYCTPYIGDCIYSTYFTETTNPSDTISFAPGEGYSAILLTYTGKLAFRYAAEGDYSHSNSDIVGAGCSDGASCPYWWTTPLEVDPGNLLIFVADGNATAPGIPKPGAEWHVEALTSGPGQVIVSDMITTVDGLYTGNMTILTSASGPTGGSHWIAATLAYERTP